MPHEKEIFELYNDKSNTPKYWIPANWALSMTYEAWKHGHIESAYYKVTLQEVILEVFREIYRQPLGLSQEIKKWRTNMEWVFNYDWVPLPLMYPQVSSIRHTQSKSITSRKFYDSGGLHGCSSLLSRLSIVTSNYNC